LPASKAVEAVGLNPENRKLLAQITERLPNRTQLAGLTPVVAPGRDTSPDKAASQGALSSTQSSIHRASMLRAARHSSATSYTPKVHNSLRIVDEEITFLYDRLSWEIEWELEPNDKTGIGLILIGMPGELLSPKRISPRWEGSRGSTPVWRSYSYAATVTIATWLVAGGTGSPASRRPSM
jgi:hypothetical protein